MAQHPLRLRGETAIRLMQQQARQMGQPLGIAAGNRLQQHAFGLSWPAEQRQDDDIANPCGYGCLRLIQSIAGK